jgi:hypothetical protein
MRREHEDPHLEEDEGPCPAVLPPMDLQVERSVDPGEPDHREDHRELRDGAGGHVLGKVVGCLADHGDVREVVEQLEVRDDAIADRRAVGPWRPSEPAHELGSRALDLHRRRGRW